MHRQLSFLEFEISGTRPYVTFLDGWHFVAQKHTIRLVGALRNVMFIGLAITVPLAAWATYVEICHWLDYRHFAPIGLHADIHIASHSAGILGIVKTYEASLTNYGMIPVSVEKCSFTSDVSGSFTKLSYNIERWDLNKKQWVIAAEFATSDYCSPAPLSMSNTHWGHLWLRPGESLSTREEETGGGGLFAKGDILRFVVITEITRPNKASSYPTARSSCKRSAT